LADRNGKGVLPLAQLEFKNVSYISGGKTILSGLTLEIESGDYMSVVGPSGSGKSTFLKLCCHLISPSEGNILFNGDNLGTRSPIELRKRICYCFQTPVLFRDTVEDNLVFPYAIRKQVMDRERINDLFSRFQMSPDYLKHDVQSLSGGEKQRIALIRTLLFKPESLLLDEVTSALDEDNAKIVEEAIESLNREGVTILWVTHNLEQSRKHANKLLTFENGQIKSLEALK
jgi:putative ABC transport system ATP-binding protein